MSNDALADLRAFTDYVETQLVVNGGVPSLEQGLLAFRNHQRDIERLRERLAPSIAEADRGEATPLDAEAIFARIRHGEKP